MISTSGVPARAAPSTTYWIAGLSTIGSISFGCAFVAGRNRVPSPAAGMTAFLTFIRRPLWTGTGAYRQAGPSENLACSRLPALEERLDDAGIELLAGLTLYLLNGLLGRQRGAMRPVVRERLPGVGDGDDARCERDLLALPALGVGPRDPPRQPKQRRAALGEDGAADLGMGLHVRVFLGRELGRLGPDFLRNPDLSEVVNE